jgi:phosphatidate cytidylyltransferase
MGVGPNFSSAAWPLDHMLTRLISGLVLLAAVVAAVWWLPPLFLLGIAEVVALAALLEYSALAERMGARVSHKAAGTATLLVCAAAAIPGLPLDVALAASTLGLAVMGLASGRIGPDALRDVAASAFAPLYIGLPLGLLVAVRSVAGREAALLLLLTVIVSDTAQLYVGRLLGRRPLAPAISPKKTVEGAIGGFAAGALAMAVIGAWWLPGFGPIWRTGLGLAVVAVGMAGDLFESQLKRSAGVKDASALIPGHGGVLDRIDALLFAAPVFYIFVRYAGGLQRP